MQAQQHDSDAVPPEDADSPKLMKNSKYFIITMLKEQSWLYLNDDPIRAIPITYLDSAEVHRINMTRKINKGFELVKMLWRLEFTSHQLADAQERLFAEWREKKANELRLFDIRLKSRVGIRNFAFDSEQQSWSFEWDTVATKDILTLSVVFNFVSNEFQGEHHPTMRLICEQYAFDSVAKAFSERIESVACVVKVFAPGCAKRRHVMDMLQKQKGWLAQFRAKNSAVRNKVMRCVEPSKYSVFQEYKVNTPMVIAFGQTRPNKQPLVIVDLSGGTSTTRTANTATATATATATKRALESAAKPNTATKKTRLEDDSLAGGSNGLPNAANGVASPSLPSSSATVPRASSSSITTTNNQARSTGGVATTKSSPIPQTATGSAAAKRPANKPATPSTNRPVGTLKPTIIHTGALPKQSSSSASRGPIVLHQVAKPSPPPPSAPAQAQKQNNNSTARVPNILRRAKKKTPVKPTGVVLMQHQQQLKKKNVTASAKSSPNPQAKNGPSAAATGPSAAATVPSAAATVPSAAATVPSAAATVPMPPPPKQNKSVPRKLSAKQPQPLEFQNKKRLAALALKQKQQKVVNVEVKTEMEESSTITEINVNAQAGTEQSVPPSTQANTQSNEPLQQPTSQNNAAQGNDEPRNEPCNEQRTEQRTEQQFNRMSNGLRKDILQNAKAQAANELSALAQVVTDLSVPKPQVPNAVQPEKVTQTVPVMNHNQNTNNNKPDDSRVVFFDNTSENETQPPAAPAPRETLPQASGVVAVRVLTGQPNPAGILAYHEVEVASSEALPTTPEQAIVAAAAAAAGDQMMMNQSQNMNLEVNDQAATSSSWFPENVTVQVGPVADTTTTEQVETKEDVKPNIADLEKKMIMLNSGEDDLAIMINLATYDQENFCQEVLVALQQEKVPIKGIGGVFLRVNMYRVRVTRSLISKMANNGVYHYELSGDPNDDQRDVTLKYAFLIEEDEIVVNNANK